MWGEILDFFTEKIMKVGKRFFIFCGNESRHRLSLLSHTRVDDSISKLSDV